VGSFLGALFVSHYVWLVGATQVVSGVLFLIGRYVPLAIALSGPVIVNIIAYHVTMQRIGAEFAVLATILGTGDRRRGNSPREQYRGNHTAGGGAVNPAFLSVGHDLNAKYHHAMTSMPAIAKRHQTGL
jgi:hypothetical protein